MNAFAAHMRALAGAAARDLRARPDQLEESKGPVMTGECELREIVAAKGEPWDPAKTVVVSCTAHDIGIVCALAQRDPAHTLSVVFRAQLPRPDELRGILVVWRDAAEWIGREDNAEPPRLDLTHIHTLQHVAPDGTRHELAVHQDWHRDKIESLVSS